MCPQLLLETYLQQQNQQFGFEHKLGKIMFMLFVYKIQKFILEKQSLKVSLKVCLKLIWNGGHTNKGNVI